MRNKEAYRGLGQVFRFSLQQYFKQKSTFVMLLVMLLCSAGSVFIMSASMKRGQSMERNAGTVYVLNESGYALDLTELPSYIFVQPVAGRDRATGSGDRSSISSPVLMARCCFASVASSIRCPSRTAFVSS